MFIVNTPIFTDSGWKPIEELSGRDKVLVRNFIGDAEFIQPFALKKRQYDGEVVTIGAKDFELTVTPDHANISNEYIYRKFKYMFSDEPKKEYITIYDDFGKRTTTIPHLDWYKLSAYVLSRGFIKTGHGRPMLQFYLSENFERESKELSDIFDRIGVSYHVQFPVNHSPMFVVSSKNTLAARVRYRFGSYTRKEMSIPDKMIYNSTKECAVTLIDTFVALSNGATQFATTNLALIKSLIVFGTINGYSVRYVLKTKAGTMTGRGITKKDSYLMKISGQTGVYQVKKREKSSYSGYVYGIDLFEGQVYTKQGEYPVWASPK